MNPKLHSLALGITVSLGLCLCAASRADISVNTEKESIVARELVGDLNHPWSIAFISPTQWLITERVGQLRYVVDGKLMPDPVAGVPDVNPKGQGGLLDVVLHPDFEQNKWLYLSYAKKGRGGLSTEVTRATWDDGALKDLKTIFTALPRQGGGRHFGSRLAFDQDKHLFISLGDRGDRPSAQDLTQHAGSIIRLHDDGAVPETNPFVGHAAALPEIYSYGHRNVQGLTFDNQGRLWAHEHGPQGGDEVNVIKKEANYGWPVITYGANYGLGTSIGEGVEKTGMMQPVVYWDPSIAPSGMAYYHADVFSEWHGNLFVGALKYQLLVRLEVDDDRVTHQERIFDGELGRIRDVRVGPDGLLYILTDAADGKLYRLEPVK